MGNCGASSLPSNSQDPPAVPEESTAPTNSQLATSHLSRIAQPPSFRTQPVSDSSMLMLKVVPVRGSFAKCTTIGDIEAFFRDSFGLVVYPKPDSVYDATDRSWEVLCSEKEYSAVIGPERARSAYHVGHTSVKFYPVQDILHSDSMDLLVVVPSTPEGPVLRPPEIVRQLSQHFECTEREVELHDEHNSDREQCWRAYARVSPRSVAGLVEGLLVKVDSHDVVVTRAPEKVWVALVRKEAEGQSGRVLQAEEIDNMRLEEAIVGVFRLSKGASVRRVPGTGLFECASLRDLGCLKLGDPAHNHLLVKGVDYRCVQAPDIASARQLAVSATWVNQPSPTRQPSAAPSPGIATGPASPTSGVHVLPSPGISLTPPSPRAPAETLHLSIPPVVTRVGSVRNGALPAHALEARLSSLPECVERTYLSLLWGLSAENRQPSTMRPGSASEMLEMVAVLRRQLAEDGCASEGLTTLLDEVESQWAVRSAADTAEALRAALEEVFYPVDLPYLTEQLEELSRLRTRLSSCEDVFLVMTDPDPQAALQLMQQLTVGAPGEESLLRRCGPALLTAELSGGAAVALCPLATEIEAVKDLETDLCRYHAAAVALKTLPPARLLLILPFPASDAICDAVSLLRLPLSLSLTKEQLVGCTYWFAPTTGGLTDRRLICQRLQTLLESDTINNMPEGDMCRVILSDIVAKAERQGGAVSVTTTVGVLAGTTLVDSILEAASPVSVASLTVRGTALGPECAEKVDFLAQRLLRSVKGAAEASRYPAVADGVTKLKLLRDSLRLESCEAAHTAALAAACPSVPSLLTNLASMAEGRVKDGVIGLGADLEAGIALLCEALVLGDQTGETQGSSPSPSTTISVPADRPLMAYLAYVGAEIRTKLPSVDALNPSGLQPLIPHIRLVLAWTTLCTSGSTASSASVPSGLYEALMRTAKCIHTELERLEDRLSPLFPIHVNLSDFKIAPALTWSAVLLVEELRAISRHDSSQLVFRVQDQFAHGHATFHITAMQCNLDLVTLPRGVLTAEAITQRQAAAAALRESLLYLTHLSCFYHQLCGMPEHAAAAGSELLRCVSLTNLDAVHEKLQKILVALRADAADANLSFAKAVRNKCVTEWLSCLDEELQPQDSQDWPGFAELSDAFRDKVTAVIDNIRASLSSAEYHVVKEFLSTCDRTDVAEAASLVGLLDALEAHVSAVVTEAAPAPTRLNLSQPSGVLYLDAILARYSTLCSLRDLLSPYLSEGMQASLSGTMDLVRDAVLLATTAHYRLAEAAMHRGDFHACEVALQLVERAVASAFGSTGSYHDWVAATDAPAALRIDPADCRKKAADYVDEACERFDLAFSAVVESFTVTAQTTLVPPNGEAGSLLDQGGRSGDQQDRPPSIPTADCTSPATGSLYHSLALQSPKAIAEALRNAATTCVDAIATDYDDARKTLVSHLAGKVSRLLVCCTPASGASFDRRQQLLAQLEGLKELLPSDTWSMVAPSVESQRQALTAEYDTVVSSCSDANRTLRDLLAQLACYVVDKEYTFCRIYAAAIAHRISASAVAMLKRLTSERPPEVLLAVVDAWADWSLFRQLCDQLDAEKDYVAVADAMGRAQNSTGSAATRTTSDAAFVQVQSLTTALGDRLRSELASAEALTPDAAGLFAQLERLADLAILLYSTFQSPFARKDQRDLQGLAEDLGQVPDWLGDALDKFFRRTMRSLSHHPQQVTSALAASELNCASLAGLLQAFSLSRTVHAKLQDFVATSEVAPLLPALNSFNDRCRPYAAVVGEVVEALTARAAAVRVVFLSSPALQEGASPEAQNTFYTDLAKSYAQVQDMSALQAHIDRAKLNIGDLIAECESHLSGQVSAVRDHIARTILTDESALPNSCHAYCHWYENLRAFADALKPWASMSVQGSQAMAAAHARLLAVVTAMVGAAAVARSDSDLVTRLVNIKAVAETIPFAKAEVDTLLDGLLAGINGDPKRGPQDITRLAMRLSEVKSDLQDYAQRLINDHAVFKGYLVNLFNTRVLQFSFGDVLGRTKAERLVPAAPALPAARTVSEPVAMDAEKMEEQHRRFNDDYRALVTEGLKNLELSRQACVDAVDQIKARPLTTDYSLADKVRDLLVQLFGYWTLSNSQHYYESHGGQSEEQAADNTSWKYLKQPHPGQIMSLFRMFGIDCAVQSPGDLENHLVQVGTGEGKSVILAMAACVFALLGNAVHCVCYSMYLYQRDEAEFVSLFDAFKVRGAITYGTFQGLCELYLNRSGNIRRSMQAIVETPSGERWSRGNAEPTTFPSDDTPKVLLIDEVDVFFKGDFYGCAFRPMAALSDATVSALLDYIWACRDGFVGDDDDLPTQETNPVPPNALPESEEGAEDEDDDEEDLLAAVSAALKKPKAPVGSQAPAQQPRTSPSASAASSSSAAAPGRQVSNRVTLTKIKRSRQYQACVERFPQWDYFIDEAIKLMLIDIKTFSSPKYPMEVVNGQIGYRVQDRIDTTMVDGYKTLFSYYDQHTKGNVSAETLQSKKCIHIDCGAYSYAEIPKIYQHLVGVSGTLASLQDAERDILCTAYNVRGLTYTASVYSKAASKLKFEDSPKDVHIVPAAQHFAAIFNEVQRRRTAENDLTLFRPVLVFFKTAKEVEDFLHYLQAPARFEALTNATLITITEKHDGVDKESRIKNAVLAGTVALLSRELGRGTDFIVHSDRIDVAGGVHVIQTFLSADVSEETQIKGRTARQGKEGSYSMVLSEEDLQRDFQVEATGENSVKTMRDSGHFVETLSAKRAASFVHRYEQLAHVIAALETEYHTSMEFLENLAKVRRSVNQPADAADTATEKAIITFLKRRNAAPSPVARLSRTLVLMDATQSMTNLIKKAQGCVLSMFEEANQVLQRGGVEGRSFEMQFAVYRNYNSDKEHLLQFSKWTSDPEVLRTFMTDIEAKDGNGGEAIEMAFWHANNEVAQWRDGQRYQVILIGDARANLPGEVTGKRNSSHGHDSPYWKVSPYTEVMHYEPQLLGLIAEEVPVHAFYIGRGFAVRNDFKSFAERTGGQSAPLEIDSPAGGATLKRLITERVLDDVAGGGAEGERLRHIYAALMGGMGSG